MFCFNDFDPKMFRFLRILICLFLVLCILVNCSPLQARATAVAQWAPYLIDGLMGITALITALGILPDSSEAFNNLRQSLYDNLVTTGVVVDSMITVYKDNAKPGSPLYIPVSIVDSVRNFFFSQKVFSAPGYTSFPVPTSGVDWYYTTDIPVLLAYDYASGLYTYYLGAEVPTTIYMHKPEDGTVSVVEPRYDWKQTPAGSYYCRLTTRYGPFPSPWIQMPSDWLASKFDVTGTVDSDYKTAYVGDMYSPIAEAYPSWFENTVALPGSVTGEDEDKPAVPIGVGDSIGSTEDMTQEDIWSGSTGGSTTVPSDSGVGSTPVSDFLSWLYDLLIRALQWLVDALGLRAIAEWLVDVLLGGITGILDNVVELILAGIKAIFVPSTDYLTAKVEALRARFGFMDSVLATGEAIIAALNLSGTPPVIYAHFENAEGAFNWGGTVAVLDMTWYSRYKPAGDAFLSGVIWIFFLWRVFIKLPSIISGVSGTVRSFDSIDSGK